MVDPELIPLKEAAQRLGVSKMTMARLVKEGRFKIYENPLDKREKLVEAREVQDVARPRLLSPEEQMGKAAA
jgi:predicted DNA-binding protein (UPF0251 family)